MLTIPAQYVLVHGGWMGGWCWKRVRPYLEKAGYAVYTPTLTALGERVHLASPSITLATHIQDIVNVLRFEDLHQVVLVGNSYAGMVITGVAQQVPERIAQLVYLDAFIPKSGLSFAELFKSQGPTGEAFLSALSLGAQEGGAGWKIPFLFEPESLGVSEPEDQAWVLSNATPFPLRIVQDRIPYEVSITPSMHPVYLYCTNSPGTRDLIKPSADFSRQQGWPYHEMATGHLPMISAPETLASLLLSLVS